MGYRLSLQGVELATYTLAIGDVEDLGDTQVIMVQGHARSVGLAEWVARIDDRFTSWLDVKTGRSHRFEVDEYETNSTTNVEHVIADLAARSSDVIPVQFHLNEEEAKLEPQKVLLPDVWDYNAFMVALRAWEQAPGTTLAAQVFRSRFLWHVDITIRGKEKLVTELGELPALRFDARTYRLDRNGARDQGSAERRFSVWISDDAGRVPLRIAARTDYGDILMDIVSYEPGSGQPLRP